MNSKHLLLKMINEYYCCGFMSLLTPYCVSSAADSCVRSLQTCWPRTGLPLVTQGPAPSWNPASRAASPTSPLSRTGSAHLPSALRSLHSRTTSLRLSKDSTRCFSTILPTTDMETAATRAVTKMRSNGNEAGKGGER